MNFKSIITVGLVLLIGASSAFAASFTSFDSTVITGITGDGQIISYNSGGHGYIWSTANGAKDLGAGSVAGVAMQGSTVIAGGNFSGVAQRWDGDALGNGSFTSLPATSWGGTFSVNAVSASATDVWIAGSGTDGSSGTNYEKGVYYQGSANTSSTIVLPVIGTATRVHHASRILGVSENGMLAGFAKYGGTGNGGGARQAVGGLGTGVSMFNNLSPTLSTSYEAVAYGISRDGSKVVGWSSNPATGRQVPVAWTGTFANNLAPTAVPMLAGHDMGWAKAVNGDGSIIAGWSFAAADATTRTSWIYDVVNGARDLKALAVASGNDLTGWELTDVTSISADGTVIVGTGKYLGTDGVTYVEGASWMINLNGAPVPEPGSIVALLSGLAGLVGISRRRK